ncbi:hypothetical protein HNQ80_001205 [Anaerosolibacter carboniphilus]|uniref:SLH domain-containing protein n=1 Tax=Anaerosolibacter carboniphilus TaxID=1417629 RepID=A0A841KNU7_9FIRM|nr:S-layer homology domain-containing protein [Anaerosolibacter carboniphilus]MBB6215116.1 hypothetical protein [Anaerosolibacter carboniphilus]
MKRFYKGLTALLIAVVALSPTGAAFAENNDYANHWAAEKINSWKEKGLIRGYEDGSIKPDNQITRAEFVTLVNNALATTVTDEVYGDESATVTENTENATVTEAVYFEDVKETDWFFNDIKKAKAAGYISGYEDQTMRPNNPISRQEAAIILANILELDTENNNSGIDRFIDKASIPAWSKGAVGAVAAAGYMNGYPDGSFMPTKSITRAETLVVLNNLLKEEDVEEDKVAPVIEGVEDQGVYEEAVTPNSDDQDIDKVELTKDGEAVEGYALGTEINTNGEYVLTVVDKAGNTTVLNFTINIAASEQEGVEPTEETTDQEGVEPTEEITDQENTEPTEQANLEETAEAPDTNQAQ